MMPSLTTLFARRYLFAKKSHSVINLIAGVSAFAVSIPIAAMVILLSVFNGFEGLIRQMYSHFDPSLAITPASGKVFVVDSLPTEALQALEGVEALSVSLEGSVLFSYRDRQLIGVLKGVDSSYREVVPIDTLISEGRYRLALGDFAEGVVGQGVAYELGVRTAFNDPIELYAPRRGSFSPLVPQQLYRSERIFPSGVFVLDAQTDGRYIITSLALTQALLEYPGRASQVAIRLHDEADPQQVKAQAEQLLGADFVVQTRYEQKADFYRIMLYEKWGIYFISLLVLLIASFSLVGSLMMLIIDKRGDIETLRTLGMSQRALRRIFIAEGLLIYGLGALLGLIVGIGIVLGQQNFGWIELGGETFLIDAYPVALKVQDLLLIVATFGGLSGAISWLTVRQMLPKRALEREESTH